MRKIVTKSEQEFNQEFYDPLWTDARLVGPEQFTTWPLVQALVPSAGVRLELAPGLRPRLPIVGTCFLDVSQPALAKLRARGGLVVRGTVSHLPYPDHRFGLLCAFDIVEHVADDEAAFAELARVARDGATLLLSVPLHQAAWSGFDAMVGHCRRYDPHALVATLARHGFAVERSAGFGMRPRSSRLTRFGMWWLARHRARAMRWYNRVLFPFALRRQRKLRWHDGMLDTDALDEVLLVCRRSGIRPAGSPP